MKKLLSILFISLFLFACGDNNTLNDPEENEYPSSPKEYIINLGLSGEITNIEDSPLSRTIANDLYGIQVFSIPSNGGQYKPYAYGLFDNKESMVIKLLEGYKYDFVISMAVNGKDKLFLNYSGNYEHPFYTESGGISLSNKFNYSLDKSIEYLHRGYAFIKEGLYQRPNIDRYYGELKGYVPADNKAASIEMKRVAFGLKIIAEGLTEGKLIVTIENSPPLHIAYPELEISEIYSFINSGTDKMAWTKDYYTEAVPMAISWEKGDGATIPLVTQNITFKRNKETTVTVKVSDNTINNEMDISKENIPMEEGDNIIIDTTNETNTDINP